LSSNLPTLEPVACPYCLADANHPWAHERGFAVVRCDSCRILFVNPRPRLAAIDMAVRTGAHGAEAGGLAVTARRIPRKVRRYESVLRGLFADVWQRKDPITWVDVGAGYGELLEAVSRLAPAGSRVEGLEPMRPKATAARARGLLVTEDYLRPTHSKVQFLSFVDVFSHLPDFRAFLADVGSVLLPGGEVFMETGNLADISDRSEFADELGIPDHLVFAGERHILGYLEEAGFEIVRIERQRVDDLVNTAKCVVKALIGRPTLLRMPYSSRYRQLLIRARLPGK